MVLNWAATDLKYWFGFWAWERAKPSGLGQRFAPKVRNGFGRKSANMASELMNIHMSTTYIHITPQLINNHISTTYIYMASQLINIHISTTYIHMRSLISTYQWPTYIWPHNSIPAKIQTQNVRGDPKWGRNLINFNNRIPIPPQFCHTLHGC